MRRVLLQSAFLILVSLPVLAVDRTFETSLEDSLKGSVPSNWWLRASWRDNTLVVFVSPPAQESFELWYDAGRQKSVLEKLCTVIPRTVWDKIGANQDIAMEQVVGGNGGKGSWRLSCKESLAEAKAEAK